MIDDDDDDANDLDDADDDDAKVLSSFASVVVRHEKTRFYG